MFTLNFNILVLLAVFIGVFPVSVSAESAIKVPPPVVRKLPVDSVKIEKQNGENIVINAELALTPLQQAQGLMFRTEMANDEGMLFVFEQEAPRSFWMKNTLIPLDIIFIKRNGEILNIHENAIPHDLTSVKSTGNAYAVLEINGGLAKSLGISAGDRLINDYFGMVTPKNR